MNRYQGIILEMQIINEKVKITIIKNTNIKNTNIKIMK
jgi:hypothetical protein